MTVTIIKISIPEFRSKLEAFRNHRQRLIAFMNNLENAINVIAKVAWVSPASKALLAKFTMLLQTVRTSLRIVEKYISDLEEATRMFTDADSRVAQKIDTLKTEVFGI